MIIFFFPASLAFADILLGMVVVPFSLVQVRKYWNCPQAFTEAKVQQVIIFLSGSFGSMDLWLLLVSGGILILITITLGKKEISKIDEISITSSGKSKANNIMDIFRLQSSIHCSWSSYCFSERGNLRFIESQILGKNT